MNNYPTVYLNINLTPIKPAELIEIEAMKKIWRELKHKDSFTRKRILNWVKDHC